MDSYVYVNVVDDRVRVLDQDDNTVLDFLRDDRIANKLACYMNIGILRRPNGIPQDPNSVRA